VRSNCGDTEARTLASRLEQLSLDSSPVNHGLAAFTGRMMETSAPILIVAATKEKGTEEVGSDHRQLIAALPCPSLHRFQQQSHLIVQLIAPQDSNDREEQEVGPNHRGNQ